MTNKEAFAEAEELFAGGVNSPVRAFKSVGGTPPFISAGLGGKIYDIEGNEYIDFVQSWGPMIAGHAHPSVTAAVIEAAKKSLSFGAPTLLESRLARMILASYPFLDKLRFVSTGTEAVMSAIRLARGVTGKDNIMKFRGCYHGHSDSLLVEAGSGAATFGTPSSLGVSADLAKHTLLADYNSTADIEKLFDEYAGTIACVVIEPIAGNMGLVPADEEFLKTLRELCDHEGALLIFDEVMSGFRAGSVGAYTSVQPDIVTFGKVIGGGLPAAALGAKKEIMDALSPLGGVYQAGTLSGNPIAMSAGIATLKIINETPDIYELLKTRAERLMEGFARAARDAGAALQTCVRGSMFGFFFNDNEVKNFNDALQSDTKRFAKFHAAMLKSGVYLAPSQFETGFISLATTDDLIDLAVLAAKEAMRSAI
ncbi:MAG: glutamate-1-semialdehyde 2,1-aminomutase [Helicobacteraceae bacterium]|jgi:glutamate-1-semialdehyde 2,1-aminomutase|nr:glutamate-1-semialdehyde 2,1-aminomutase [Helicobacteraceae bacterium]